MKTIIIALVAVLLFAGCVTSEQLAVADYGPAPTDAEAQSKTYFEKALRDPDSAKYKFETLGRGWVKDGLVMGGKTHYGWIQVVSVNAKNGFGGYTGAKDHYLFFRDGKLVRDITGEVVAAKMGGLVK